MAAEKLIVSTLKPIEVGDTFPSLPLHLTLMPWFKIEQENIPVLEDYLGKIASKRDYLELIGEEIAMFGRKNDVKVRKVARTSELVRIHSDISAVTAWSGGQREFDYIHEKYSPHVSFTDGIAIDQGEIVKVDAIQLIDRDEETETRIVEATFPFDYGPGESNTLHQDIITT